MFKTIPCEEYESGDKKRNSKRGKKCHRYYCPFAHGQQELRTSDLSLEERKAILGGLDMFPSDKCCNACALPCTMTPMPPGMRTPTVEGLQNSLQNMPPFTQPPSSSAWPFSPLSRPMPSRTQADIVPEQRQSLPMLLPSSAYGHDPFPRGQGADMNSNTSSLAHKPLCSEKEWKSLGSPAFIKIGDDGVAAVSPWEATKTTTHGPFGLDLPAPKWMKDDSLGNETSRNFGFSDSESLQLRDPVKPRREEPNLEEAIKQLVYTML
jgi:hypothetical protein